MSERNQKQCIVLLPAGPHYERLFNEILQPVFADIGFVPRRLQPSPQSAIPVDLFVDEIEQADALFADVSENIPELWIAAGCAAALGKPLCLISSTLTSASPLGIQYLPLIPYRAHAFPSDYLQLQHNIAARLSAISSPRTGTAAPEAEFHPQSPTSSPISDDLAAYEVMALSIIDLKASDLGLSPRDLGMEMKMRDSAHLTSHAMNALRHRNFIEKRPVQINYGNEIHISENLFLTRAGKDWLILYNRRGTTHRSTARTRDILINR
ncbi:MAG: hypothetical protein ABSA39_12520 [Edaphobacter sp.]